MGVQIRGDTGNVIATRGTFSGNVGIAGTLTYEDATNVDAVGLITARSGIEIGASPGVGASISRQGNAIFSGITTIGSKEVGAGITLSPDGHISVSGVTTSSTIHIGVDTGVYGENLVVTGTSRVTGIASFGTSDNPAMHVNIGMSTLSAAPVLTVPDMIKHSGDPETRVRFDTGTVKVETTQIERLRIGSSGQIGLSGANYGSSGQVLTSQGSSSAPQWATPSSGGLFSSYAVITDEKSNGTDGGDFNSGAWRMRDLNSEKFDPDGIVSVSGNEFTLGSGTYYVEVFAPAYGVARHMAKIYSVSSPSQDWYGESAFAHGSHYATTHSFVRARITCSGTRNLAIAHQCETSRSSTGFGIASNFGNVETYTVVKIFKES